MRRKKIMLLPFPIYALCVFDWVFAVYVNCSSSSFLAFCPPTLRLYNIVQHQRLQIYVFNRVWKKDYWILFFLYQKKNFNLQRSKNRNLIPNIQKTKKLLFTLCYLKKIKVCYTQFVSVIKTVLDHVLDCVYEIVSFF